MYGSRSITSIWDIKSDKKSSIENFPNPFSHKTTIKCNLQESAERLLLDVYDLAGVLISHDAFSAIQGNNNLVWQNTTGMAGAYIYKVSAIRGNKINLLGTGKMFVTKH